MFVCFLLKNEALSLDLQFTFSFILFDRMGTSLNLKKVKQSLVVQWLLDSLYLQILVSVTF